MNFNENVRNQHLQMFLLSNDTTKLQQISDEKKCKSKCDTLFIEQNTVIMTIS